jgi:hypothetical protein
MSGEARDFNNIKTRSVTNFFFLQDKAPKEFHAILIETLEEYTPSYAPVQKLVSRFKRGAFSNRIAPRPGRH